MAKIDNNGIREAALEAHLRADAAWTAYSRAQRRARNGHGSLVAMVMDERITDPDDIVEIFHDLVGGMYVNESLCYLGDRLIAWLAEHRPDVRDAALRYLDETPLHWLGYTGSVEWSEADGVYYGKVLDVSGLISYEGNTLEELTANFYDSVADYMKLCRIEKIEPEEPTVELTLDLPPDVRQHLEREAATRGVTPEQVAVERLIAEMEESK